MTTEGSTNRLSGRYRPGTLEAKFSKTVENFFDSDTKTSLIHSRKDPTPYFLPRFVKKSNRAVQPNFSKTKFESRSITNLNNKSANQN